MGPSSGDTIIYHVDGNKYARTFTLVHWGITFDDVGPVHSVQWTADNAALSVGWTKRGLSVWSVYGCRLMCTIPQLEGRYYIAHNTVDML
jgi:hypothetical protein